jgi:N-acetyltransferase 10
VFDQAHVLDLNVST